MRRVLTPVAKFWICKRGSAFAQEAMECLGGNGYVEEGGEGVMARIYREMPLNSIWEGAGNIMALDLLRALRKRDERKQDVVAALEAELDALRGTHPAAEQGRAALLARLEEGIEESEARRLAQDVALRCRPRPCAGMRRISSSRPSARRAWAANEGRPSAACPPRATSAD